MGLDNYASRSPGDVVFTTEDQAAFDAAGVELCGGMMSGEGGSFRGKVYLDVVDRVADVSLGQEWIPPETMREVAVAFERCDPAEVVRASSGDHYPVTEAEVRGLAAFFRLCADRELGLIGWW